MSFRPIDQIPFLGWSDQDWTFLTLLGIADEGDRELFASTYETAIEDIPAGACCPILVADGFDKQQTEAVIVHELVHLIDRPFISRPPVPPPLEERITILSIVEGNAVRIEQQFLNSLGLRLEDFRPGLDDAPPGTPLRLVKLRTFPFVEGLALARAVEADSGEAGIDDALGAPPRSSEQVLFPDAYLAGEEPVPVDPPTPSDEDGVVSREGSLGAFLLALMIEPSLGEAAALDLVRQWAGDSYVMTRGPTQSCLLASIKMDDPSAEEDLAAAIARTKPGIEVAEAAAGVAVRVCAATQ